MLAFSLKRLSFRALSSSHSIPFRTCFLQDPTAILKDVDPEVYDIIKKEQARQHNGLELIASENFASGPVMEALGSCFTNKYSEGYPGMRYYGGNEFSDENERLCQKRALEAFDLDPELWGVNVQPYSGSPANFAVYTALLKPHDRLMGLDLSNGGHLTHGFSNNKGKRISATSLFWESLSYNLNEETGLMDYDSLEFLAAKFVPKLIVAGTTSWPRQFDYERLRKIADSVGAWLHADMAHISGLVAGGVLDSPFEFCDVVTSTSHKTLRGPRGGIIWYRKGVRSEDKKGNKTMYTLETDINNAVFPSLQGGPHNHQIAALNVALKEAMTPEFKLYCVQVLRNAKIMESEFLSLGYRLVSRGTDIHFVVVDLRNKGIDGARVEIILELAEITVNKNTVPGDSSPFVPSGLRIGSPAMTTRGFKEDEFRQAVNLIDKGIQIALEINAIGDNAKSLKRFKDYVYSNAIPSITELNVECNQLASSFPLPGHIVE